MRKVFSLAATMVGAMALAVTFAGPGLAQTNFYEGKQIRLIVGSSAATTYDLYARLIARFLPKHIPGNPTVVVQIMTGASGMVATNHVFNIAPRDGTVILGAHSSMALAQITDVPNIQYDARQFRFIGRISSGGHDVHYVLSGSNVRTFGDLLKQEVIVAGTGPSSNSVILPTAINQLMGGKLKIMRGYSGPPETALAVERGEVQMAMQSWDLLNNKHPDWIRDNKINALVQYNPVRHAKLPDVPTILEVSVTDEQKQVWSQVLKPVVVGYGFGVAPIPADRLAILRNAFDAMLKDPELLAEAAKAKLPIEPMSGAELDKVVAEMFEADPKTMATVKKLLSPP
jgi:tripartite-type tricarboxylate transporter receptor subunit TctC